MMAIDKHKPVARWAVYEAVFNLGLSLILVKRLGIYGVAWGTSISMVITHLAFWPRYIREVLDVGIGTYLWDGLGKITVCVLPFTAACAWTEYLWHPQHVVTFFSANSAGAAGVSTDAGACVPHGSAACAGARAVAGTSLRVQHLAHPRL